DAGWGGGIGHVSVGDGVRHGEMRSLYSIQTRSRPPVSVCRVVRALAGRISLYSDIYDGCPTKDRREFSMLIHRVLLSCGLCVFMAPAVAATILVSAASSLGPVFGELAARYEAAHPGREVQLNTGASD